MSSKATKAELDFAVMMVERYQGYSAPLLTWIVAGGRFDRVHLKPWGEPKFEIDRLQQVTMFQSWLYQAKQRGRLVFKDSAVMGEYTWGDIPKGYYTIGVSSDAVLAGYADERERYLKAHVNDNVDDYAFVDPTLKSIGKYGVMDMADKL